MKSNSRSLIAEKEHLIFLYNNDFGNGFCLFVPVSVCFQQSFDLIEAVKKYHLGHYRHKRMNSMEIIISKSYCHENTG